MKMVSITSTHCGFICENKAALRAYFTQTAQKTNLKQRLLKISLFWKREKEKKLQYKCCYTF